MSKRGTKSRRCTTNSFRHGSSNNGGSDSCKQQTTLSMFTKNCTKRKSSVVNQRNNNNSNCKNRSIVRELAAASLSSTSVNCCKNATGDAIMKNVVVGGGGGDPTDVNPASSFVSISEDDYDDDDEEEVEGDELMSSDEDDSWCVEKETRATGAVVCHYDRGDANKTTTATAFAFRNSSHRCCCGTSSSSAATSTRSTFSQVQLNCNCGPSSNCSSSLKRQPSSSFVVKPSSSTSFRQCPPPNIGTLKFREGVVPLPKIAWANESEVWNLICWKDVVYSRNPHLLQHNPALQPKMRAILIDWLAEVCEVYKLHRETFHLAIDFVDRYLSKEKNVPKANLQLIGVTALFIAAKLEEIYPPKCSDFAYVTDKACTVEEISAMELCMLKVLNWALAPITAAHWLTIYLQIIDQHDATPFSSIRRRLPRDFAFARYHRYHFIHLAQLIDLCLLDVGSLQFSYSVLAACAFAHILEPESLALHVSGFKFEDIATCYRWMMPFAKAAQERGEIQIKHFVDIADDDMHNIQTHVVDLDLLERSQTIHQEMMKTSRMSPVFLQDSLNILPTPPPSDERPPLYVSRFPPFVLQP